MPLVFDAMIEPGRALVGTAGAYNLFNVMAAVANAIYNALGKRFYALPMSPPKILEGLEATAQAAE